jgi:hypothetical protein
MKRNKQTTLGLLSAGLVIGLAAGILLAPMSGKEARTNVSKRAGGAWNKANGVWRFLSRRGKSEPEVTPLDEQVTAGRH